MFILTKLFITIAVLQVEGNVSANIGFTETASPENVNPNFYSVLEVCLGCLCSWLFMIAVNLQLRMQHCRYLLICLFHFTTSCNIDLMFADNNDKK
jgi:hypothetical protein